MSPITRSRISNGAGEAAPRRWVGAPLRLALGLLCAVTAAAGEEPSAPAAGPAPAPSADDIPRLITGYRPQYPPEFVAKQVEGEILVDFVVCPDGTVTRAHVLRSSDPRLSHLAEDAVSRWVFAPGRKKGVAVYTHMQVPVVFQAPSANAAAAALRTPEAAAFDAHMELGRAAVARKDYAAARSEFSAAIRQTPDSAAGYIERAQASVLQGRSDEALGDFIQAAALDPADQAALDAFHKTLADSPEGRWSLLRYQTFETVWRTVFETYFDPGFGGVDWPAMREKYSGLLSTAADEAHLRVLLQQMLGELRHTHFAIVPREAAVFNPSERVRIGTTGTEVAFIEGRVVVAEVKAGTPGYAAGIRPGDSVSKVNEVAIGTTLEALARSGMSTSRGGLYATQFVESRLTAAVGTKVRLELVGAPQGSAPRQVTVECGPNDAQWSEPIGYFPSEPIRYEGERGRDGVAYLRFNIFVPPVMKKIRVLLRSLRPGDGLIVDLRGNGGGVSLMASGICGLLCRDEFVLGSMHMRQGVTDLESYPQAAPFDGPVAVLIDGSSASTSEILAAALKEKHRARLFGETSAGAALPSMFKSLPSGDLFQFAIADVTTPSGALLEGNGVAPDRQVLRTRLDLNEGHDPVLAAAREWVDEQRRIGPKGRKSRDGAP